MKLSTPAPWLNSRPALALIFFASLGFVQNQSPVASAAIDPVSGVLAQDEALYSHSILRMASGDEWLTPKFLGRLSLVKPPLLHWFSAISLKLFGRHLWALRLPSAIAAAAILTLLYRETGPVGWLLCFSQFLWRSRVGLVMMDDLLTLFYLLAILTLAKDKKLERHAWLFGAFVGFAVLTKWFAGVLPLALLSYARPPMRRWLEVAAAIAIVAAPWHVYQLLANREWFLAEYLGVELLSYAVAAPVQSSAESHWAFYAARSLPLLPLAVPLLLRKWNPLWLLWCAVLMLAIAAYSYQNATYLIPLIPALLFAHRGWIPWYLAPLALFGLLTHTPSARPRMIDNSFAGRELLHLDPDDQLRSTLFPNATVRYIFLTAHLPPNGPLDFEQLGVATNVETFLVSAEAKVDVVLAPNIPTLKRLIEQSPQRDFLLPLAAWRALAMAPPHEVIFEANKVRLKSRAPQPGPRPNHFELLTGPGFQAAK